MAKKPSYAPCNVRANDANKKVIIEVRCLNPNYQCSGKLFRVQDELTNPIAQSAKRKGSKADLSWSVDPAVQNYDLGVGALLRKGADEGEVEFELSVWQDDTLLGTWGAANKNPVTIEAQTTDVSNLMKGGSFLIRLKEVAQ